MPASSIICVKGSKCFCTPKRAEHCGNARPHATRPPYAVAKLRRPKGACYCDHDDEECYKRGHWQPTQMMFERGGDWYIMSGGKEHRLLDLAPELEREALRDPVYVAARRRTYPATTDFDWPDNALDSF